MSEALDADLPDMQAGYGLIGTVVVAILLLVVVGFWVLSSVWPRAGAADRVEINRTDESS
ncbi:hypothetical protein MVF96_04230 [Gordonia hongkongensis]|nr:hypothetical protein [Gordonia hongkongensis]UPG69061.1 hypothetical protein MVF96_04230 [Gordonia hongkongensis]